MEFLKLPNIAGDFALFITTIPTHHHERIMKVAMNKAFSRKLLWCNFHFKIKNDYVGTFLNTDSFESIPPELKSFKRDLATNVSTQMISKIVEKF